MQEVGSGQGRTGSYPLPGLSTRVSYRLLMVYRSSGILGALVDGQLLPVFLAGGTRPLGFP